MSGIDNARLLELAEAPLREALIHAMEDDPFPDDFPVVGTSGHCQRIAHYADIAVAIVCCPAEPHDLPPPSGDPRDAIAIYDLTDDPYFKARLQRVAQQRDDAINEAAALRAKAVIS